ncbi:hypothetical protein [Pseudomonas paeninsulae]|uniref:hypothetical protein n=1 Tax=Pseudomonas paeninsulae TaxID=3110772 RepID=UPI002D76C98A|nr:hypothetical protein [Pseudomonas sp. IT1137]
MPGQAAKTRLLLFLPWALLILLLTALLYERLQDAGLDPLLGDQQGSLSEGVEALNRHLATQRGNPAVVAALDVCGSSNQQAIQLLG